MKKRYVPTHLKYSNRRIIYDTITCGGDFSRAALSRKSGISGPTILKIIDFFLDRHIVVEATGSLQTTQVGRTPTMLRFNADFAFCLAAHLDGETLTAGVLDMCGGVRFIMRQNVSGCNLKRIFSLLPELVAICIQKSGISRNSILGLGLGLPAVLDSKTAVMEFAPLIGVQRQTDCRALIRELSSSTGLQVYLENDVNAAAWGEYRMRHPENCQDMAYLSLGTGLGAGIILNGHLLRGRANMAGEIGYLCCDPDFIAGKETPGWLESRINLRALSERYGHDIRQGFDSWPAAQKDSMVLQVASCLALAIANINAVVGAELYILDGQVPAIIGQPLFTAIEARLDRLSVSPLRLIHSRNAEAGLQGLGFIVSSERLTDLLRDEEDNI